MENEIDVRKSSDLMFESVVKTFAEMAFVEVIEQAGKVETEEWKKNILKIDILKPMSGSVFLFISDNLREKIIGNIYAMHSGDLKEIDTDDCLLEILNVLTGNFLTAYFGKDMNYKIELPQLFIDAPDLGPGVNPVLEKYFNAEGEVFKVVLYSIRYRYP